MQVTSLEKMETIVSASKSLSWDGWTVVDTQKNPTGWTKTNGAFINDSWHTQNRFEPTEQGWDIPGKFVR
jgi:hypothetical protein